MEFKFLDIIERDIDMVILEEFASSQEFCDIFLSKIGLAGVKVLELEHSKTDIELGESDITVIVQAGDKKHGLLIENKIDAIAQPNQCQRYFERGNLGVKNADYDNFDVFIVAPQKYINEDDEAMKYPNKVLYEELEVYFKEKTDVRSKFKLVLIEQAIRHQKSGYKVVEVASVTDFWNMYIDYQEKNYPQLNSLNSRGPKGARSTWPMYKTVHKDVTIVHKMEKGYVDLSFRGGCDKINMLVSFLEESIGEIKKMGMTVEVAGKSAVLRKKVPVIDVFDSFNRYESEVEVGFKVLDLINDIALRLDVRKLQEIMHSL